MGAICRGMGICRVPWQISLNDNALSGTIPPSILETRTAKNPAASLERRTALYRLYIGIADGMPVARAGNQNGHLGESFRTGT